MKIMDRDVFDRENIFGLGQENSGSARIRRKRASRRWLISSETAECRPE